MLVEGPVVTILAGAVCAMGLLKLPLAYAVVTSGDLVADSLYYALGRWGRKSVINRWGRYVGLTMSRIERLDHHIGLHGIKMLLMGKLTHGIGATFLVAAGVARMSYPRFLLANAAATLPKSLILLLVGYYFGRFLGRANLAVRVVGIVAALVGVVIISVYTARAAAKDGV
jgi:membrane-associated protein